MSYQNQRRPGGRPRQERRSLDMTIRFTNEDGKIDADLFDKTAKRVATIVANKSDRRASQLNKSTQLRRFYDELVMWEEKVRQNADKFDEYLPFICRVPCDHIPERSYPLFQARDLLQAWVTGLQRGE